MPDLKFFDRSAPLSLREIAEAIGASIAEGSDPNYSINDVAPLDKAGAGDLGFFDNVKYRDQFMNTKAGACITAPDKADLAPKGVHLLLTPYPYKAYALAAQKLYPEPSPTGKISETASIDSTASVGKNSLIGSGVCIGSGASIGEGAWIEANAVIGRNVSIGKHCRIGANASISHAVIGDYVRIYPGVRIGQEGFGFAMDFRNGHVKVPQLGRVIIEDHVEIGANTCIDRGSGPDTVIGQGTWIDNLVQVAHNVKIGRGCVIAAQVGISGSTVIEDFAIFGGQAGLAGHLHIGRGARIAAQSGVIRDIPAGEEQMGYPSIPLRQFMRQVVLLNRLIKKEKTP